MAASAGTSRISDPATDERQTGTVPCAAIGDNGARVLRLAYGRAGLAAAHGGIRRHAGPCAARCEPISRRDWRRAAYLRPVSDRFGRRPVLLAGLAGFLVGTTLCGAAWSLPALIAGRVLQALGACAGIVLSRAIIRDVYEREAAARGLALVMMAMTLAPAILPASS
jgi:MFS family permease